MLSPRTAACEQHLVGGRALTAHLGELHVEQDRRGSRAHRHGGRRGPSGPPSTGSSLITSWLGSGRRVEPGEAELRRVLEDQAKLRLRDRQALARANEERNARPAPVVDLEPKRRVRLGGRVGSDTVDVAVAVVLAPHVVSRIGLRDRAEHGGHRVLDGLGVASGGRLHGSRRDNLHEVVDDDVAQRADWVVEVPAILDAEVLRQRDLDALDVVPVPHRLQHRVARSAGRGSPRGPSSRGNDRSDTAGTRPRTGGAPRPVLAPMRGRGRTASRPRPARSRSTRLSRAP